MENKDLLKISSIILTFVLVICGGVMSYFIYSAIISEPSNSDKQTTTKIEINQSKLTKIQTENQTKKISPEEDYGRVNAFLPYK